MSEGMTIQEQIHLQQMHDLGRAKLRKLTNEIIKQDTELQALRDEVARLRAFIQRVGHPQWCSGFMTRNIDACTCGYYVIIPPVQAALTSQGGKAGVNG